MRSRSSQKYKKIIRKSVKKAVNNRRNNGSIDCVKILTLDSFKTEIRKLAQTLKKKKDTTHSDKTVSDIIHHELQDVQDFLFDITSIMSEKLGIYDNKIYDLMLTADRIYGCFSLGCLRGVALVDITISGYYVESIHSLEHRYDEMMLNRIEKDIQRDGRRFIYLNTPDVERFERHGFEPLHREGVIWKLWRFFGIKHNYWSGIMDGGMTTLMLKKIKLLPRHRRVGIPRQKKYSLETISKVGQVRTISLDRYKHALQELSPIIPTTKKNLTKHDINMTILSDLNFIEKRKQQIDRVPFFKLCRESLFIHSIVFISCDKIYACFSGNLRGIALVNESDSGYYINFICSSGYRCGQQIFAKIEEDARERGKRFIYLEAVANAVNWYKKQGFIITDKNKNFSRLPLMDTLMHREVSTIVE